MERDSIKVLKKILNSNEAIDINRAFKKEQQLTFQNKKNLLDQAFPFILVLNIINIMPSLKIKGDQI